MEDQRICIFGGFKVIVSINIFVYALSPDKARRAYLQCFYVFLMCQMNLSNTFPYEQRNKNAFYSKLRKNRYVDFPLYGRIAPLYFIVFCDWLSLSIIISNMVKNIWKRVNTPHLLVCVGHLIQGHTIKFNCLLEISLFEVDVAHVNF